MSNININQEWDGHAIKSYEDVEKIKKQLRKSNWKYLCEHPEIRAIIRLFLHQIVNKQPKNVYEFAAEFFNLNTSPMLITMINQQLKRVHKLLKSSHWSEYDGEMIFGEKESTHSLLSTNSIPESINSILSYALLFNKREETNQHHDVII